MILVIDKSKRNAEAVSEMLYYMGFLSHAADFNEGLSEAAPWYRAVLIMHPSTFADLKSYVLKIKSYFRGTPVFSLLGPDENNPCPELFELNFREKSSYVEILTRMVTHILGENKLPAGSYMLAGIDASASRRGVYYFDKEIPLTRTETMIVRFLIRSYPVPMSAKDILKYSFKCKRVPEPAGIRTHISSINKKFRAMRDRNLILSMPDAGYVIGTPEIILNGTEE